MPWYGTVKAGKLRESLSSVLVFDLETTGIPSSTAEILQISICDGYGNVMYSSYVKPKRKSWKEAERINGISPSMVANAPSFEQIRKDVQRCFDGARYVAGFNCNSYDIPIIQRYGIALGKKQVFDVMQEFKSFAPFSRYRLKDCAHYFGVSYSPHDATEDARATALCMQELLNTDGFCKESRREKSQQPVEQEKSPETHKHKKSAIALPVLVIRHPLTLGVLVVAVGATVGCYIGVDPMVSEAIIIAGIMIELYGVFKILRSLWLGIKTVFRRIFARRR